MATIDASKAGYVIGQSSTTFATARQNASGVVSAPTNNQAALQYTATSGRGSLTHAIRRTFLYFDTSGLTGTISNTSLNIVGAGSDTADVIVLKSTAFGGDGGTTLATSDFFSTIDFSTAYSSEYASWDASGTNDITLNSTSNTDIQNDDAFICAIVEHDKDYSNTAATSATSLKAGIGFGTTITLTYTEGSSGYANDVIGVATANIGKVLGVATANIGKVIGV